MSPSFKERTPWPIWLWLFLLFLAGSLSLAIWAALGNSWALISTLVQFLGLLYLSQSTVLAISVDEDSLHVGNATLERRYITALTPLSASEMAKIRGPLANPSAYLALRFWISTGVKIEFSDPHDQTPYWLVSSKKAHQLADALMKPSAA